MDLVCIVSLEEYLVCSLCSIVHIVFIISITTGEFLGEAQPFGGMNSEKLPITTHPFEFQIVLSG